MAYPGSPSGSSRQRRSSNADSSNGSPTRSKSGSGLGFRSTLKTASADLMTTMIAGSVMTAKELPMEGSTAADKEALSLQNTTINFRNFVAKSGPIFWFQDQVEAIVSWEDPTRTLFWCGVWACMSFRPVLFLLAPYLIVIAILLRTYSRRFPPAHEEDLEARDRARAPAPKEYAEGSVDYLANMQNIQIMMGRISMGSDLLRAYIVPLLNWSDPKLSIVILHVCALLCILTALIFPFIPWTVVLLVAGEGALFASHPWTLSLLIQLHRWAEHSGAVNHLGRVFEKLSADDALSDQVLDAQKIVWVVCMEHERFRAGTWSHDHLDETDPQAWVTSESSGAKGKPISGPRDVTAPEGFRWVEREEWTIDHTGGLSNKAVDKEGWMTVGPESRGPSLRERRWRRRAYKPALAP